MTIEDALKIWLDSHKLKIHQIYGICGWTCRDNNPGKAYQLSNHMTLYYTEDGWIQITGSLSKISYKAHISDPSLFPILDRALDEEDKWIRDGHRAPE